MKNNKQKGLAPVGVIVILVLLAAAAAYVVWKDQETTGYCTLDAQQCPDGSYVSRVAPSCEFAPCPDTTIEPPNPPAEPPPAPPNPPQSPEPPPSPDPNAGKTYRSEKYGFEFEPPDGFIVEADDSTPGCQPWVGLVEECFVFVNNDFRKLSGEIATAKLVLYVLSVKKGDQDPFRNGWASATSPIKREWKMFENLNRSWVYTWTWGGSGCDGPYPDCHTSFYAHINPVRPDTRSYVFVFSEDKNTREDFNDRYLPFLESIFSTFKFIE